jgi:gamma-glutamyl phosphate reductase
LNRLKLTKEKLSTVSQGIRAIAQQDDPIDKVSALCSPFSSHARTGL